MLQTAVNNSSYTIIGPDGQSYTLADSDKNIFTGQLTSLENLFRFKRFNGDINYWDVSNVTSLKTTFRDNNVFTGNISSWDVSNVTDMRETFRGAVFNGDITSWDVSSVTNMELTFLELEILIRTSLHGMFRMFQNSVGLSIMPNFLTKILDPGL